MRYEHGVFRGSECVFIYIEPKEKVKEVLRAFVTAAYEEGVRISYGEEFLEKIKSGDRKLPRGVPDDYIDLSKHYVVFMDYIDGAYCKTYIFRDSDRLVLSVANIYVGVDKERLATIPARAAEILEKKGGKK
ncbi:MAG: hypothetical protein AAB740_01530 [Patescibacteria group bacterium]